LKWSFWSSFFFLGLALGRFIVAAADRLEMEVRGLGLNEAKVAHGELRHPKESVVAVVVVDGAVETVDIHELDRDTLEMEEIDVSR
jgi:hypothetical protein